jgi:hypothetical protein
MMGYTMSREKSISALDDIGIGPNASRHGPSIALAGLIVWAGTILGYFLIGPPDPTPGVQMERPDIIRLVFAVVLGGVGTFAGSILSAIGMLLSLAERKHRPGLRATRGVSEGIVGIGVLLLVLVEILRRVAQR